MFYSKHVLYVEYMREREREREREVFIHVCDIVDNNSQLTDHIHWAFNSFCMNGMELLASLLVFAYVTYVTWYFSGFLVL